MLLVDFSDPSARAEWQAVGDAVMGGVSAGRLVPVPGGAAFTGHVSLEHGGGFASLRAGPRPWPTAGATGFALTVRGDGRRYRLTLRTAERVDALQYQAGFVAREQWAEVVLPCAAFEPRYRGRPVAGAPPLEPGAIRTLGLLIAERQAGAFRLELARLEARTTAI